MYYTRLPAVHCCFTTYHVYHGSIAELYGTCRRARGISVICVYNCILIVSCSLYRFPSETGM